MHMLLTQNIKCEIKLRGCYSNPNDFHIIVVVDVFCFLNVLIKCAYYTYYNMIVIHIHSVIIVMHFEMWKFQWNIENVNSDSNQFEWLEMSIQFKIMPTIYIQ